MFLVDLTGKRNASALKQPAKLKKQKTKEKADETSQKWFLTLDAAALESR